MPTDHRAELQKIRTFPSLIRYLRDEMGWPIDRDSFEDVDDLFYDFTPEELGIEPKTAAKIETIKRLRPLSPQQPWGIFFVKFQPGRLPVIALRRILSQVALKKRASANSAERAAWSVNDLLFVSNYGEGDQRQISFAHFSQAEARHDLPTLKVLGWDNLDTALHLDSVAKELTENLAWPDDDADVEGWRNRWRAAFSLRHREVVTTSKELSIRLAELARAVRDRIKAALAIETEIGPLTKLMKAFQEALVHDLDADGFADMYAQTIAYGLLSARIADPQKKTADDFAAHMRTNPFLRELMETFLKVGGRRGKAGGPGIDFDELGVSEVVELLDDPNTHIEAVVRDFGDKNPQEDPVIHFYELFLKEYDAKKRIKRGVFYTPRPVVSYIVRSVDELLRTEFGLEDGLADTTTRGEMAKRHKDLAVPEGVPPDQGFVQILDPATGTGTFLVEVIDLIHKTLVTKWNAQGYGERKIEGLWNEYVPKHLLPRLHGYELLMAPYAIAHLKIGLKLYETGYRFGSDERARIYLTNALEPPNDFSGRFEFVIPALANEARAVNAIKQGKQYTVVIGNPPYSDASQNLGEQFARLIERFRHYDGARIRERGAIQFEHVINNDYVKFWGLAIRSLTLASHGVVCMITSNSFLEGKSFRGLREAMLEVGKNITITNLHGEGWAGTLAQSGISDKNVFEIQTGVAITQIARVFPTAQHTLLYAELIGSAEHKLGVLSRSGALIGATQFRPDRRHYLAFVPPQSDSHDEYWSFPQADTFFTASVDGIKTSRDVLVIGNSFEECRDKILRFAATRDVAVARKEFRIESADFNIPAAQRHIQATFDETRVARIAYRPFDIRYIYYDRELILSHRMNLMPVMLEPGSRALVFASRLSSRGFDHVMVADALCAHKLASHDINSRMFPLVATDIGSLAEGHLRSYVRPKILESWCGRDCGNTLDNAKLFGAYVYAIANAPSYRDQFIQEISQDFPRIPLPKTRQLSAALTPLGEQLLISHLLRLSVPDTEFQFSGELGEIIGVPRHKNDALWIGKSSHFVSVEDAVVAFRSCGYQVCSSWFSAGGRSGLQRRGTPVTSAVIAEFRRVLWAIRETLRLRAEIDEVIEQHGGWPGAFAQGEAKPQEPVREAADADNVEPPSRAAEPKAPPHKTAAAEQVLRAATRTNPTGRS